MKIIHVMGNIIEAGGVPSFVYDLCRAQVKQNHEVHLLCLYKVEKQFEHLRRALETDGVVVHVANGTSLRNIILKTNKIRRILGEISTGEKTVLNMHLKIGVLSGVLATIAKNNFIRVETYHSGYHHYWLQAQLMKPFVHRYIAVSRGAARELIEQFGINKDKIATVYNGINMKALTCTYKLQKQFCVLSVGRFSIDKQFEIPVKGFAIAEIEGKYTLIGDGEEMGKALTAADKCEKIHFLGEQSRHCVFEKLAQTDVVLMSSKHEGNSIFLLEAIGMKRPLILSDISSFREVFHEAPLQPGELFRRCKWGYSVLQNDPFAYAAVFREIEQNRAQLKQMSAFVASIATDYDISRVAATYSDEYKRADRY